jgi:hypothetical protein
MVAYLAFGFVCGFVFDFRGALVGLYPLGVG